MKFLKPVRVYKYINIKLFQVNEPFKPFKADKHINRCFYGVKITVDACRYFAQLARGGIKVYRAEQLELRNHKTNTWQGNTQ